MMYELLNKAVTVKLFMSFKSAFVLVVLDTL